MGKDEAKGAMQEAIKVATDVTHKPTTNQTYEQRAKVWLEDCKTRNLNPNKPSTLTNRRCVLEKHILPCLGSLPLSSVGNQAMRTLAAVLFKKKKLSPQSVKNILTIAKTIKATAVDDDGNQLFPTKWNKKIIDAPAVEEEEQRRPIFTAEEVTAIAEAASGKLQMACVLLAASGLRAGELLGLECCDFNGSAVQVRQSIWGGKVQKPKTKNAKRFVELHPSVCALFKAYIGDRAGFVFATSSGRPLGQANFLTQELHPLLETLGIPKQGFHCFRRYRNTYLRQQCCPAGILKYWMGHSTKQDMSDLYDRSCLDVTYRRDVALSKGTGFALPKTLTPKLKKLEQSTSELGAIGRQTEAVLV
jgi:integrase